MTPSPVANPAKSDSMTPENTPGLAGLAAARARMEAAKRRFTDAARASMAGAPDAPARTATAFQELAEARAALRALRPEIAPAETDA